MRSVTIGVVVLLCAWLTTQCRADIPAEVIRAGKKATAFVQTRRGEGSAFCVTASGLFVTNAHVLEGATIHSHVTLVLYPGESVQRVLEAEVVQKDTQEDLALLQAPDTGGLTVLELGSAGSLAETQSVVVFGYPFGSDLAIKGGKYPAISVNIGRITAMRHKDGNLHELQLEAALNPGNSGGPVLNTKGQVVGMDQSGVPGARIAFAIAVNRLREFLSRVQTRLLTPIAHAPLQERQEFGIELQPGIRPVSKLSVMLALTPPGKETREVEAKYSGGNRFSAQVASALLTQETNLLRLSVKDASSVGNFVIKNKDVSIDGHTYKLSEIKRIGRGSNPYVVLTNGKKLMGSASGLNALASAEGGGIRLDVSDAQEIQFSPVAPEKPNVKYHIIVRAGEQVVCETSGVFIWDVGPPAAGETTLTPGNAAGRFAKSNGTITFAPPHVYPVASAKDFVTAGDLDGDGWPDVVIGVSKELGVLYNRRNGTLEPYQTLLPWKAGITNHAMVDLNGDGRPDIICTDKLGRLVILYNLGRRTFSEPYMQNVGNTATVCVADVNGDGRPDLVIGLAESESQMVKVLLNTPSGSFEEHTHFLLSQGGVCSFAARDLNGDGCLDLAISFASSTVDRSGAQIYYGDGKGGFEPGPCYYVGTANMYGATLEDFNGDGKLDLAMCSFFGSHVSVLLNSGKGDFLPYLRYPAEGSPAKICVADFNGDGRPDMAVSNGGKSFVSVFRNRGQGLFMDPVTFPTGGANCRWCCIADFNRDGKPDIVVQNEDSNSIAVLLNTSP